LKASQIEVETVSGDYIDDPMLALIARFAACCSELEGNEETFLRQQYEQVRGFVEGYPESERQERALEWIARNAEGYRRKWQRQLVREEASTSRCPDCPLTRLDDTTTCEIHARWLDLLKRYVSGATSSRVYVEDTLTLLRQHKERLRRDVLRLARAG
jgi:hypothetical protein